MSLSAGNDLPLSSSDRVEELLNKLSSLETDRLSWLELSKRKLEIIELLHSFLALAILMKKQKRKSRQEKSPYLKKDKQINLINSNSKIISHSTHYLSILPLSFVIRPILGNRSSICQGKSNCSSPLFVLRLSNNTCIPLLTTSPYVSLILSFTCPLMHNSMSVDNLTLSSLPYRGAAFHTMTFNFPTSVFLPFTTLDFIFNLPQCCRITTESHIQIKLSIPDMKDISAIKSSNKIMKPHKSSWISLGRMKIDFLDLLILEEWRTKEEIEKQNVILTSTSTSVSMPISIDTRKNNKVGQLDGTSPLLELLRVSPSNSVHSNLSCSFIFSSTFITAFSNILNLPINLSYSSDTNVRPAKQSKQQENVDNLSLVTFLLPFLLSSNLRSSASAHQLLSSAISRINKPTSRSLIYKDNNKDYKETNPLILLLQNEGQSKKRIGEIIVDKRNVNLKVQMTLGKTKKPFPTNSNQSIHHQNGDEMLIDLSNYCNFIINCSLDMKKTNFFSSSSIESSIYSSSSSSDLSAYSPLSPLFPLFHYCLSRRTKDLILSIQSELYLSSPTTTTTAMHHHNSSSTTTTSNTIPSTASNSSPFSNPPVSSIHSWLALSNIMLADQNKVNTPKSLIDQLKVLQRHYDILEEQSVSWRGAKRESDAIKKADKSYDWRKQNQEYFHLSQQIVLIYKAVRQLQCQSQRSLEGENRIADDILQNNLAILII